MRKWKGEKKKREEKVQKVNTDSMIVSGMTGGDIDRGNSRLSILNVYRQPNGLSGRGGGNPYFIHIIHINHTSHINHVQRQSRGKACNTEKEMGDRKWKRKKGQ